MLAKIRKTNKNLYVKREQPADLRVNKIKIRSANFAHLNKIRKYNRLLFLFLWAEEMTLTKSRNSFSFIIAPRPRPTRRSCVQFCISQRREETPPCFFILVDARIKLQEGEEGEFIILFSVKQSSLYSVIQWLFLSHSVARNDLIDYFNAPITVIWLYNASPN